MRRAVKPSPSTAGAAARCLSDYAEEAPSRCLPDRAKQAASGQHFAAPESEPALYVYGIAKRDGMVESAAAFVEGVLPGIPVEALPVGDLAVIVSRAPMTVLATYDAAAVADIDMAAEKALAHHRVLANLAMFASIAPMRVGTVLPGQDSIFALLARSGRAYARVLERVAGAQEWGVKLFADMEFCSRMAAKAILRRSVAS